MKGKGTTDAIFMARQMQENFRAKGKKLYFGFVDLEKAILQLPAYALPSLSLLLALYQKLSEQYMTSATQQ